MPADIDPAGQFEPIHAAHAIEQVAILVQFHRPLTPMEFAEFKKVSAELKNIFPDEKELKVLSFSLMGVKPRRFPLSSWQVLPS